MSPYASATVSFFDFQIVFTGSGEVGDEVPYARHSTVWEGWQGVTVFGWSSRKTADRYEKADFTNFALLGPKNIFYIITQPRICNRREIQWQFSLNSNSLSTYPQTTEHCNRGRMAIGGQPGQIMLLLPLLSQADR